MFSLHECVCTTCVPGTSKETISSFETGVMDGFKPPCRCCKLNPDLLKELRVLLISDPTLYPILSNINLSCIVGSK